MTNLERLDANTEHLLPAEHSISMDSFNIHTDAAFLLSSGLEI